ncbi:flagellar hook-basal body complex protein FliE [Granulosicoccaceae sp. 1_MG-2023]|nr:flagellar hook-basal body complex protein FliE [Granulosicoccaceae sp. 1_MG-2023]
MDNRIDSTALLSQLRVMADQAGIPPVSEQPATRVGESPFTSLLENSLQAVNVRQQSAARLTEAFELGDPSVDLAQVSIEMQKARIAFEALSQVRNKVIAAYQEIMNMSV